MSLFRSKKLLIVLLLLGAVAIFWGGDDDAEVTTSQFRTQAVDRGDIIQTISANGTLTPVVLVEVGTQISGTVAKLHVNFNDAVVSGQILAELDPALLNAQLEQSKADLLSSNVVLNMAIRKIRRNRILKEKGFISSEAMDIVEQELDTAHAQHKVNQAQVTRDRTNLNYSIIKSPISGVVIARNIDLGQTVAANFQTPVLFQIANDLSQMLINISVAEADIGHLNLDQQIHFTVDTYPERSFTGAVKQVRLNPTIQENIVTYNVVAAVNNDEGALLPGMTANIRFIIDKKNNALRVPNAALRFRPQDTDITNADFLSEWDGPVIYKLEDDKPVPVGVSTGITDGNFTEIFDTLIVKDDQIILREIGSNKDSKQKFRFRMF